MEHYPQPSVHTTLSPYSYIASPFSSSCLNQPITSSSTLFALKSEDPSLDEELLNLKLERLRILEKIRDIELENSSITTFQENEDPGKGESASTDTVVSPPSNETVLEDDEVFAKKLLAEEIALLKKASQTEAQVHSDFNQQFEMLLNDPSVEQDISHLKKDEELARRLEQQYLNHVRLQMREDERLARTLSEQMNSEMPMKTPPKLPVKKNNTPQIATITMNKTSEVKRLHAIKIHNDYCNCKKLSKGNNGHIFKLHDQYCKCCILHVK